MKNFPNQFNKLTKFLSALRIIKNLIENSIPVNDENFGERLTRERIYTFRDKSLTVDEYFRKEAQKTASNRGYLRAASAIRRLFELLGLIFLNPDKTAILTHTAIQRRLAEHQKCVRLLAELNEEAGFEIFEGKFDCLAVQEQSALLYEVKTLASSLSDEENQTIKGVGQLKYYNYSIVQNQMGLTKIREIIVFSRKPGGDIIKFCNSIDIIVAWLDGENFKFNDFDRNRIENFDPQNICNIYKLRF
jgi:hypothetical protein